MCKVGIKMQCTRWKKLSNYSLLDIVLIFSPKGSLGVTGDSVNFVDCQKWKYRRATDKRIEANREIEKW